MARTRPNTPDPGLKRQAARVVRGLARLYPDSTCALTHDGPYQLVVATILSAQCTDARVNMVTPELFRRYPNAGALAAATQEELEEVIRSTGFFRAKAKNLIAMASRLVERHDGEVPADLEALTNLAGVGRKTAHVVLGTAFRLPSGVVVDTHVKRLAKRLGLTDQTDPVKVEHELAAIVPQAGWIDLSHRLIDHGRKVCAALRPKCDACGLSSICPKVGVAAETTAKPRRSAGAAAASARKPAAR